MASNQLYEAHKITCTKLLPYRYRSPNGGWTNYEKFDREATDAEIIDLQGRGFKVVTHRRKKMS
jgi:hypothetical protein